MTTPQLPREQHRLCRHLPRRRILWVALALLPLAHIAQIVRLLDELDVVLEVSHVLARDAHAPRASRLPASSWRDLDGVAGLERQLRAVAVEAPSNDFLTLRPTTKPRTDRVRAMPVLK